MYKVVICDDERIIREGLKITIPWQAYHFTDIYLAKDGIEGLSLIREHQPELVITDIRMPRLDGVKLLDEMANLNCHTIILSSYDDYDYMKAAIKHHVLDYLLKPIDENQLKEILAQLIKTLATQTVPSTYTVFQPLMKVEFEDYYVNCVLQHIREHYYNKINISHLITNTDISESYLMRIFKDHVGISILDYLNRYRVYKSLEFLKEGYKYYEIAEKVGFTEYKLYSYHFKKYLNMSPSEFIHHNH